MNIGETMINPKSAVLEDQLVDFLADGLNITRDAAQTLSYMSPDEVEETVNGVLSVVDENGVEGAGVIARSEWLKRLSGKCAQALIELMTERQQRTDHSDRSKASVSPNGSLFGPTHVSGRHTSYEVGAFHAGHRTNDRLDG